LNINTSNGYVGIGTTNPEVTLDIRGTNADLWLITKVRKLLIVFLTEEIL